MTKRGTYPADIDFELDEIRTFTGSKTKARMDIYVSDPNGDDTNDGTKNKPLKTIGEAYKRIPDVIDHPVIVHIGPHSSGAYSVPTLENRTLRHPVVVIGDGAGQGSSDGFSVLLSSQQAQAGSDYNTVVTGGGLSVNELRGKTIEVLSGGAQGDRRTIEENGSTNVIPTVAFSSRSVAGEADFQQGDSFRVVEPEVTIQLPDVVSGSASPEVPFYRLGLPRSRPFPGVYFVNFKANEPDVGPISPFGTVGFYGVEFMDTIGLEAGDSVLCGCDSYVEEGGGPGSKVGSDIIGEPSDRSWRGWGLSFAIADDSQFLVASGVKGFFTGLVGSALSTDDHTIAFFVGTHLNSGSVGSPLDVDKSELYFDSTWGYSGERRDRITGGNVLVEQNSHVEFDDIHFEASGSTMLTVGDDSYVQMNSGVNIASSDVGILAERGGAVLFDNGISVTSTTTDTRVADANGSDNDNPIGNFSSTKQYVASSDGSKIQRRD